MSLPDMRRAGLVAAVLVAVGVLLAACNARPLYGTATDGTNVRADLAFVDVAPTDGRVGQRVRNDLLFLLHGGGPARDAYIVDLSTTSSTSNIIVRRIGGQPQGATVTVQTRFGVRDSSTDEEVFWGRVARHASYELSNQRFANDRAELDAENRAAREVAEEIRMRLAAFFASDVAAEPQINPRVSPSLDDLTEFERVPGRPGGD